MELAAMVQHQLSQTCTKLAREIVADKDRGVHSSVWLFDLTSRWSNFYDHQVVSVFPTIYLSEDIVPRMHTVLSRSTRRPGSH